MTLAEGSYARAGELVRALRSLPARFSVAAQERLVVPTQVDASRDGRACSCRGRSWASTSVPRADPSTAWPRSAAAASGGDAGASVAVVESGFAEQAGLPTRGTIARPEDAQLQYVGQGTSPEYFLVTRPGGGEFGGAESRFAVLFVPLRTAQVAAGRPDAVNELLVTLPRATDPGARPALEQELDRRLPGSARPLRRSPTSRRTASSTGTPRATSGCTTIFAWLIVAGAAFASFNLASRVVEAQRREIGVGMALGVNPRELTVRPLLLGIEIALLGALLGLALGLLVRAPLRTRSRTCSRCP